MASELSIKSEVKQLGCKVVGIVRADGPLASATLTANGYALTLPPEQFPFLADGDMVMVLLQVMKLNIVEVPDLPGAATGLAGIPILGRKQ